MKPVLYSSPNQKGHIQKGEQQANILKEHRCKNPQQNNSKPNPTTHQKDHSPLPSWFYPRDAGMVQHTKSINVI
jgi:hypothetical protein